MEEEPIPTSNIKPEPSLCYLMQVSERRFYNRMAKRPLCSLRLLDA